MLNKFKKFIDEKQYLPTFDDIENEEANKIAQKLKGESNKNTLTNIVEWQEQNLQFWVDRHKMFILFYIFLIVSLFLLPVSNIFKLLLGILLISFGLFDLMYPLLNITLLIAFIIVAFTFIFLMNFSEANAIFPFSHLIILSMVFGGIITLLSYLIIKYRNIKSFQPEFKLEDTFKLSLSVDKIIKYRLAICRDYAKLTATLLLNLYNNSKIYSILIPQHVAIGIKFNGKIYVLDQRLPVLTLESWLSFWKEKLNKNKLEADIREIICDKEKIKTKKVDTKRMSNVKDPKINTENLTEKVVNRLNIKGISDKNKFNLEIPLKNYALCFEKDGIVEFSLVKAIIIKVEKEFCGNINKISDIEVSQNKKDLILNVYFK